jgi:hypothetical protein
MIFREFVRGFLNALRFTGHGGVAQVSNLFYQFSSFQGAGHEPNDGVQAVASNPIGVTIDPDELLAQYRNGVSAETLLRMPQGEMSPIPSEHGIG